MYCTKRITDDMSWVGADDRRLAFFEGVYGVPDGVSYNSYIIKDEKTILFDTVDKAVCHNFFENLEHELAGRGLDYLVISHMEPDHAATIADVALRYPEATIVCNAKIKTMLQNYFHAGLDARLHVVAEGDTLSTGRHNFTFVMAPMVHWPEVMMTYDTTDKILFSADAFGSFGALNGRIFSDECDFMHECIDEARRYYTNIVGKYGPQVQAVLKKAAGLEIKLVCPLHSFVWRQGFGDFLEKYLKWSSYEPEENGVLIAYASVYGHTENAANILAAKLCDRGVKVKMYDTSVTPASYIVSDALLSTSKIPSMPPSALTVTSAAAGFAGRTLSAMASARTSRSPSCSSVRELLTVSVSPMNSVPLSPESTPRMSPPLVGAQEPFSMRATLRFWRLCAAMSCSSCSMVTNMPAL